MLIAQIDPVEFVLQCAILRNHRLVAEAMELTPIKVLVFRDRLISMGVKVPPFDLASYPPSETFTKAQIDRLNVIAEQYATHDE